MLLYPYAMATSCTIVRYTSGLRPGKTKPVNEVSSIVRTMMCCALIRWLRPANQRHSYHAVMANWLVCLQGHGSHRWPVKQMLISASCAMDESHLAGDAQPPCSLHHMVGHAQSRSSVASGVAPPASHIAARQRRRHADRPAVSRNVAIMEEFARKLGLQA